MKIKLLISLALFAFVVTALNFNVKETSSSVIFPVPTGNNNILDTFLFGAIDNGWEENYSVFNPLKFNVWHSYNRGQEILQNGTFQIYGWTNLPGLENDLLTEPVGNYSTNLLSEYDQHWTNSPRLWTIAERPKITRLCYGQRSDYQCEEVPANSDTWYYSFQTDPNAAGIDIIDTSQHGSGQGVRYCQRDINQTNGGADWVVRKLKCNNEQCNTASQSYEHDSSYQWLVKPRIRIDSAFAANPNNSGKLVCRIDIRNWGDTLIKSADIRVRNFKISDTSVYHGSYVEEYFFIPYNDTSQLNISTGYYFNPVKTRSWAHTSRLNGDSPNKTDIQVYWYGECDMWIDYVRMDNDVAHNLLSDDPNNLLHQQYLSWIREEDSIALRSNSPLKYYIEHPEYNNLVCVEYVNNKLQEDSLLNSRKLNVMTNFNPWLFYAHLHHPIPDAEEIVRKYQKTGITQILAETYPLTGDNGSNIFSKIPNTLPRIDTAGILATPEAPDVYDEWLQHQFDHFPYGYLDEPAQSPQARDEGSFRFRLTLANQISKMGNIPMINMPQAHLYKNLEHEVRREPTNEELDVMTNIAISHGARGLLYYSYIGFNEFTDDKFQRGFTDRNLIPRVCNVYKQNKWNKLIQISSRVQNLGPVLMSFDNANRRSFCYSTVYTGLNERDSLYSRLTLLMF